MLILIWFYIWQRMKSTNWSKYLMWPKDLKIITSVKNLVRLILRVNKVYYFDFAWIGMIEKRKSCFFRDETIFKFQNQLAEMEKMLLHSQDEVETLQDKKNAKAKFAANLCYFKIKLRIWMIKTSLSNMIILYSIVIPLKKFCLESIYSMNLTFRLPKSLCVSILQPYIQWHLRRKIQWFEAVFKFVHGRPDCLHFYAQNDR